MPRIIARLDIKNECVIKGVHLEGFRKIGNPYELAARYYESGADEILFMDCVASLYDRNNLFGIIEKSCKDIYIPIAVGGGIRTIKDISEALNSGADKVIINTAAIKDINFITEAAKYFGNQCIVGSIEAKYLNYSWYAYFDNGREPSNFNAILWAQELAKAGCGEIIVTSVDKDGTMKGFDIELAEKINNSISNPLIVSGGCGSPQDVTNLLKKTRPSGLTFASALHYKKCSIDSLKAAISNLF